MAEDARFGALSLRSIRLHDRRFAGFMAVLSVVVMVAAVALFTSSLAWPFAGLVTLAAEQPSHLAPAQPSRTNCEAIGTSDLRSPAEGLWYRKYCTLESAPTGTDAPTCNRTLIEGAEFVPVSEGLFVYRQQRGSPAYLWYSNSPECFDIVSARVVTALCVDQTVTFNWNTRGACAEHGGVFLLVNGR